MDKTSAPSPRIAYLTGTYPAISHTFILREIEALRDLGLEVETCSVRAPAADHLRGAPEQQAANTTFYILAAARNPLTVLRAQIAALRTPGRYFATLREAFGLRPPGLRALLYQMFYFVEATILAQHLKAQRITHLHNHFASSSATVAMLTAQLAEVDFSYTLHGPSDLFEAEKWRLDAKTARARFVACISHFARSQVMLFSDPKHWQRLRIIHCGVLPEMYARSEVPTGAGTHLVFVGRLAAVKGLRVLIDALNRLKDTHPDLRLTLVGDGDDRTFLETAAAPLGEMISFVGYQSQDAVADILAGADALVLPSFAEGVPVVLMEAMASGKPVIATRVAGVAELVEDGVSGYLVPPGDAESLADRITQISADPKLRKRMGIAGRKKVTAEFDIRHEARLLAALFKGDGGSEPRPSVADDA